VAPERRDELFTAFGRGAAGTGLGLTVARGFAEAMGGALVADSSAGGGLTMRLRVPVAPAARVAT
jgi:two-component system sensor histidine kinase KdpD